MLTRTSYITATLVTAMLCSSFSSSGQRWERVQLDDDVSFLLPSGYQKTNYPEKQIFSASTEFGFLQVETVFQPHVEIHDVEDLNGYYHTFQKSVIEKNHGNFSTDSTFTRDGLYVRVFEFESYRRDTTELHWNLIVLIDQHLHSFSYTTLKRYKGKARKDREALFGYISFRDKTFQDQLALPGNEPVTVRASRIIRYVLIGMLICTGILFIFKQYKLVKSIVKIISIALLSWGGVCVILYLGNLAYNVHAPYLLTTGVVCLVVGFLLRILKLQGV